MIFEAKVEWIAGSIIMGICLILLTIMFWSVDKEFLSLIWPTVLLITIPDSIYSCRTLEMNAEGCVVSYLWYRKEYRWEEFKVKRIEKCRFSLAYQTMYKKLVYFSPKAVHKPRMIQPELYGSLLHPFSFICINFIPPGALPKEEAYKTFKYEFEKGRSFEVDEKLFREKMQEWGVELTEE